MGSDCIYAIETLKDAAAMFPSDARPGVADRITAQFAHGPCCHRHLPSQRCVSKCVIEQNRKYSLHDWGASIHRQDCRSAVKFKLDLFELSQSPGPGNDAFYRIL